MGLFLSSTPKADDENPQNNCCCGKLRMHCMRGLNIVAKKMIAATVAQTISYSISAGQRGYVDYGIVHVIAALLMAPAAIIAVLVTMNKYGRWHLLPFLILIPLQMASIVAAFARDINLILSGERVCTSFATCSTVMGIVMAAIAIVFDVMGLILGLQSFRYLKEKEDKLLIKNGIHIGDQTAIADKNISYVYVP